MPGMNGHEVAQAIRATPSLAGVMLVALTGWGAPDDVERAGQAGFDHHLTKPVSLDALEAALGVARVARVDSAANAANAANAARPAVPQ
jgi:CheY-like chemotaxis protein